MSGISSVSRTVDIQDVLINSAVNNKASQMKQAIGAAVLKQTMQQTERMGEAIVDLINSGPNAAQTTSSVDIKI